MTVKHKSYNVKRHQLTNECLKMLGAIVGVAIKRSRVQLQAQCHCTVNLGKLFTPVCLCHKQYNLALA